MAKINVKDYGATGDGTTDDSSAIASAISAMAAMVTNIGGGFYGHVPILYFPAGKYKVTTKKLFQLALPTGESYFGIMIQGDGAGNTEIFYTNSDTSSDAFLFYNDDRYAFATIQDILFTAGTGAEKFMYMTCGSGGRAQGLSFSNLQISNYLQGFQIDGTVNASENKFYNVSWTTNATDSNFITLNNLQSVNWAFTSCTLVSYTSGTIFNVQGGGCINLVGANVILFGDSIFLNIDPSEGGLGSGNYGLWAFGSRFECQGETSQLLKQNGTEWRSIFLGCNLTVTPEAYTGSTGRVQIVLQGEVRFQQCDYSGNNTVYLTSDGSSYDRPLTAHAAFENCNLDAPLADFLTIVPGTSNICGRATARVIGCTHSASGFANRLPVDVDFGFDRNTSERTAIKKSLMLALNPDSAAGLICGTSANTDASATWQLPLGATLTRVAIFLSSANSGSFGASTYIGSVKDSTNAITFATISALTNVDTLVDSGLLAFKAATTGSQTLNFYGKCNTGSPWGGLIGYYLIEWI